MTISNIDELKTRFSNLSNDTLDLLKLLNLDLGNEQ